MPQRFTEWVQYRKLHDRDPRLPMLADKLRVKAFVGDRLGEEWVTPTLWHGVDLPDRPEWPAPFVVKSRHGCNQRVFVRSTDVDWEGIRRRAQNWVRSSYGFWLDEWLYSRIVPGIIVEPFIGIGGKLPTDYKLYVFHGRVAFVQVHLDREDGHRWILLDRNWRRVSSPTNHLDPQPPASLEAMMAAAEQLARGFDFVRVDFYDLAGSPRFGEMTFYPGSGLDRFDPPQLDNILGALWAGREDSGAPTRPKAGPR